MIKVGRAYATNSGRRFLILARKNLPSSNGCNFIGEDVKSGVVAYFNHKGFHAWDERINLKCDPYKWIGLTGEGVLTESVFLPKEELKRDYSSYLRIEDNDKLTICWLPREGFYGTYI